LNLVRSWASGSESALARREFGVRSERLGNKEIAKRTNEQIRGTGGDAKGKRSRESEVRRKNTKKSKTHHSIAPILHYSITPYSTLYDDSLQEFSKVIDAGDNGQDQGDP